ncbi:MAG TPA: DciA family protein [Usitatibacter sp.]|nr:DciA family protein [Usitatibacter sp.]
MAPEQIAKLLGGNAELRPLTERLEDIQRLQKRYRALIPGELARASRVCAIDGTTVVICAASGPVAAALRHVAPRILEALRGNPRRTPKSNRDQELNSIRIEVQVVPRPPRRAVVSRGPMPREQLGEVARGLQDSPLKETLERISGTQRKSTRSKT